MILLMKCTTEVKLLETSIEDFEIA